VKEPPVSLLVEQKVLFSILISSNKIIIYNFIERIFEEQLEGLIRAILENGIPDLNIPPLDPLVYKDTVYISETDMPGMMT
jgi:hypothetical protein